MNNVEITVTEHAGRPAISISGKLTSASADKLQRVCLAALKGISAGELVIDMAGVTYIDSLCLGRLVAISKSANGQGKKIVLTHPQDAIRAAFKMLHIDRVIEVR